MGAHFLLGNCGLYSQFLLCYCSVQSMLCFLVGNRLTPSAVDVADITKTSAVVSWTAASSYIDHMVSVEGHCETVTRPGVHRCLVTGMAWYAITGTCKTC